MSERAQGVALLEPALTQVWTPLRACLVHLHSLWIHQPSWLRRPEHCDEAHFLTLTLRRLRQLWLRTR